MKVKYSLFPYPILSNFTDDYENVSFNANYNVIKDFSNYKLNVNFDLNDKQLLEKINEGSLSFLTHVECPETSFREKYTTKENNISIPLDQKKIIGDVDISSFIVATEDIKEYSNLNFSKFYGNRSFSINKGNTLASSPTERLEIKYNDDPHKISSIIKISSSDKVEYMQVDTDSDLIYIKLPKEQYKKYFNFSQSSFQNLVLSAIILPCLVQVLLKMKKLTEDDEDTSQRWFKVIENKLKGNEINIEDIDEKYSAIDLAQRILSNPVEKGLEELKNALEVNYDDED